MILRFLLGGALVSLFAALGTSFKPKTFAGLFGSAPPISLASLSIAFHEQGLEHVRHLASSMALGALGLAVYSACCLALIKSPKVPVVLGAFASWLTWGVAASLLFFVFQG